MTPEFTHCALHVRDLDQSIAFYESYCGLGIVKEHGHGDARTVWMAMAASALSNFLRRRDIWVSTELAVAGSSKP